MGAPAVPSRAMFEIGNTLRESRQRRCIDLVEAEQDTKIRSKYLSALETEQFDILPGAVYTRGFLRTYARYLGLEPQVYIDEYNDRFGRFEDAEEAGQQALSRQGTDLLHPQRRLTLRRLLIASLVILALLAWWGLRTDPKTTPNAVGLTAEKPTPQPLSEAANQAQRAPAATPAATAAPRPTGLTLRAVGGTSWVEIRRGSAEGTIVFSGTIMPGKNARTYRGKRFHITAGIPSVMRVRVGSKLVPLTGNSVASWMFVNGKLRPVNG